MPLIKEVVSEGSFRIVKTYNHFGLLLNFTRDSYGNHSNQDYYYNDQNRIQKNLETITDRDLNGSKIVHVYDYNGENYRILSYKTHKRGQEDITTFEYVIEGEETWHSIDQLVSVHEFKFIDSHLVFESFTALETNERYQHDFIYKDGFIINEERHEIDGTKISKRYDYEKGRLVSEEEITNGAFYNKKIYCYENSQVVKTQVYKKNNGQKYLAYETLFTYNLKNELCSTEKFGRYNSTMILFFISEVIRSDNIITTTVKHISSFDYYSGYFDFASMLLSISEEFKTNITETMFNTECFDTIYKDTETFDHKGNLLNYASINPDTGECFSKTDYHNEYNGKGEIEFVVCIENRIGSNAININCIKKCYYSEI